VAVSAVYAEGRHRIGDLLLSLPASDAERRVPTCPGWTVRDVVAHVVGVCADILAGNLVGVATDPWTAAQVRARRGRSLAELVEEWSDAAPRVEAFADHFPGHAGPQWVADLTTHEHDIRTAVDQQGARRCHGVELGLEFLVSGGLHSAISERGLPPLGIQADQRQWIIGNAERPTGEARVNPAADVGLIAPSFELFRALTGRRSTAQIRRLEWRVDAERYLPAFQFGPFTTSSLDIVE
jgi:uncharacterized protein (TIGR03083 family)